MSIKQVSGLGRVGWLVRDKKTVGCAESGLVPADS